MGCTIVQQQTQGTQVSWAVANGIPFGVRFPPLYPCQSAAGFTDNIKTPVGLPRSFLLPGRLLGCWLEGQRPPKPVGDSPHHLASKDAHPVADLSGAQSAGTTRRVPALSLHGRHCTPEPGSIQGRCRNIRAVWRSTDSGGIPVAVVRGEPLYGLRNPSLRAPAMNWERELKPGAAGARYGATRATRNAFTPTQGIPGAGFLKQPNATGVGSGTTSATRNAPTPTQSIPAGVTDKNPGCGTGRSPVILGLTTLPLALSQANSRCTATRLDQRSALLKKRRALASFNSGLTTEAIREQGTAHLAAAGNPTAMASFINNPELSIYGLCRGY